ncbi:MAG: hypothetical protein JST64_03855 [Actinobacteria bacterium]|nr:hypothetical protein [Actinomycetota bacterium]
MAEVQTEPIPGAWWRSAVAVVLVVLTVVGATVLTDDDWPFAPFRMFSHPVKPTGRVTKVDFTGVTESGRELRLDASAFGLRRAEVEGQQSPSGRLTAEQMASLAAVWNKAHPSDPLVELRLRRTGRMLVDGRPEASYTKVVQTWTAGAGP